MEVRPGYKQTEVGVIPEKWEVKRLGDLFEVTSSKRVFKSEWKTQGVPFYRARELAVLGETGFVENELFIDRDMYEDFKMRYGVPAAGDMLVTGVGTLGKTYVVAGDHEFYFKDGNIIWFKVGSILSSEFLRQLYLTPLLIKQIGTGAAGTTVGTYTITAAKKTVIPLPPLPEQRMIAAALSDVDALLSGLDRLIAKKRDLKQAAMQQLLTGQTRLPGFSGEWEVKSLFDLAEGKKELFNDGDWIEAEFLSESGIRLIQTGNIGEGRFEDKQSRKYISAESFKKLRCKELQVGDILICRLAEPAGRACILPNIGEERMITAVDVTIFRPPTSVADRRFLSNVFNTRQWFEGVGERCGGSTRTRISRGQLGKMEIMLPTLPEQTAIAAVLSDMDAELAALEARRDKTRDLKQAMMQELLTGRTRLV